MLFLITSIITVVVLGSVGIAVFKLKKTVVVGEDSVAITINKDGFIKRVLPQGRHTLQPYECVDFAVETKTKLTKGKASDVTSSDGILVNLAWSGTYAPQITLIGAEGRSQKLRNLPNAEKAITRNVDLCLRKLVGNLPIQELFKPAIRERLERQLSQVIIDRLKPLGIALNGINLQTITLPNEVAEALNKAKAIETLDGAIRHIDPTTREVVKGAYQLDEILHWDQYLPIPTRHTMKRVETVRHN